MDVLAISGWPIPGPASPLGLLTLIGYILF